MASPQKPFWKNGYFWERVALVAYPLVMVAVGIAVPGFFRRLLILFPVNTAALALFEWWQTRLHGVSPLGGILRESREEHTAGAMVRGIVVVLFALLVIDMILAGVAEVCIGLLR